MSNFGIFPHDGGIVFSEFTVNRQMLNTVMRSTRPSATNKKGWYKHTHRVQEKSIGVPRSLTTAEDAGRVEGSREQEKREPHRRQPDPTHTTVQVLPPASCGRSERSGLGISWNARQSRPTRHMSV